MNIHFKDAKLLGSLIYNAEAIITVGSEMYGTNNENSDKDCLVIYKDTKENLSSFLWEHHQLQYKSDNVDWNCSNIQTFIRNALTGDSTINLEVIFSKQIIKSNLSWLSKYKKHFINYQVIKSYLGLAKRDLKLLKKIKDKDGSEYKKKVAHFVRGILFANMLFEGDLDVQMQGTTYYFIGKDIDFVLNILENGITNELLYFFENEMVVLRNRNNNNKDNGNIEVYMNSEILKRIDEEVKNLGFGKDIEYENLYYDALSNGIQY